MQSVGELVALGAQHRAHQLHGVELAGQGFDVGAIAHDQDGAQFAALTRHVSRRHHHDPIADRGERRRRIRRPEHLEHTRRQTDVLHRPARFVGDLEQAARLVVDERCLPGGVDGQHALIDTVQDRRLAAYQLGHFGGLQAHRQAPPPSGQKHRADDADEQRHADKHCRRPHVGPQLVVNRGRRDADADLADHPIRIRREHRYFRADRRSERAGLPRHHLVARQCLGRIGADMFTELVPVRMGEPDALIVGDHHE